MFDGSTASSFASAAWLRPAATRACRSSSKARANCSRDRRRPRCNRVSLLATRRQSRDRDLLGGHPVLVSDLRQTHDLSRTRPLGAYVAPRIARYVSHGLQLPGSALEMAHMAFQNRSDRRKCRVSHPGWSRGWSSWLHSDESCVWRKSPAALSALDGALALRRTLPCGNVGHHQREVASCTGPGGRMTRFASNRASDPWRIEGRPSVRQCPRPMDVGA